MKNRGGIALFLIFLAVSVVVYAGKPFPRDEVIPTIESSLQELAMEPPLQAEALARSLGMEVEGGMVRVVIEYDRTFSEYRVTELGGRIVSRAEGLHLVEVDVPIATLLDLARLSGVVYVRRPYPAIPADGPYGSSIVSEGVGLTGADVWHAAGVRGKGITVAVIDSDFSGLSDALARGEVGNVVFTCDYTGYGLEAGGNVHGTACAEIVHDMAPDAQLILMKALGTAELANAVDDAIAEGADIITHSYLHVNSNFYDGTGPICQIAEWAAEDGVLWVNAAGNSGAGSHWEGDWQDSDGDGWLEFAPGDEVNEFHLDEGWELEIYLTWDGWPWTDRNYDLYLVDEDGNEVASSTNWQTGTQEPTEGIKYIAKVPGTFGIKIRAVSAPPYPRLELFCLPWGVSLEYSVSSSSIPAPGNLPAVLTVGGVSAWGWLDGGPAYWLGSRGPTNISRNNPYSMTKPDICGPTNVSGMSYGLISDNKGFGGTSASAPHVAGAAALIGSVHPDWSMEMVRRFLEDNAIDRGAMGKDNVYGYGQLYLPPPTGKRTVERSYGTEAGWYLVSRPLSGGEANPFHVSAYTYDPGKGRYTTVTGIEQSAGYWVYLAGDTAISDFGGEASADVKVNLATAGWHQIGVPWGYPKGEIRVVNGSETKPWADAVAAGWVDDGIYGYSTPDDAYYTPSTLDPWTGYWVKSEVDGLSLVFLFVEGLPVDDFTFEPNPGPFVNPPLDLPRLPSVTSEAAYLHVWCYPNPVFGDNKVWFEATVRFSPDDKEWAALRDIHVEVYDLSGLLVWSGSSGDDPYLEWDLRTPQGDLLANGVYLYRLWAEVGDGKMMSRVGKLVVLR